MAFPVHSAAHQRIKASSQWLWLITHVHQLMPQVAPLLRQINLFTRR